MQRKIDDGHFRITIKPGEYHASKSPCIISTLLGSCVAACLFDPVNKVMGMNHFMLSGQRYGRDFIVGTEAGRYGVHAMELLINHMLKLGAEKKFLLAKAFGGSKLFGKNCSPCSEFPVVGDVNSTFIREFLHLEAIPLVAESLGGTFGRMIHFSSDNFCVYMRRIKSSGKGGSVVLHDLECSKKSFPQRLDPPDNNVELWK